MFEFFVGFILGLVINIPIGPINVLVVNSYLRKGFSHSISVGLGGAFMDFFYFFIILSGLNLFDIPTGFDFYYQMVGSVVIILMGLKELFSNHSIETNKTFKKNTKTIVAFFLLGIFLYVSNPALVVSMTAIALYIKGLGLIEQSVASSFLISLGLFVGSSLWFYLLAKVVEKYKDKILNKFYPVIVKTSGVLLIGFGSYFLLQVTEVI